MLSDTLPLRDLQRSQNRHDLKYHPDIVALGTIGRLKHMALHNVKYAARFAAAELEGDVAAFEKVLTDSFIIALSTANILTYDLGAGLPNTDGDGDDRANSSDFAFRYLQEVGRMAKACESIDHLENFPFRPEIVRANATLTRLVIEEAGRRNIDLVETYARRIAEVEARSGFSMFAQD